MPEGLDPFQQWVLERIVSLQSQFFAGAQPDQAARAAALWLLAQPGPPQVHAALRAMIARPGATPPATSIRPPAFERFSVMPDGSANWLDDAGVEMVASVPPPPATPSVPEPPAGASGAKPAGGKGGGKARK